MVYESPTKGEIKYARRDRRAANRRVAVIVHQKARAKVKKDISSVEDGEESGNFPSLPGGSIHSRVDVAELQTWQSSSN